MTLTVKNHGILSLKKAGRNPSQKSYLLNKNVSKAAAIPSWLLSNVT